MRIQISRKLAALALASLAVFMIAVACGGLNAGATGQKSAIAEPVLMVDGPVPYPNGTQDTPTPYLPGTQGLEA
jgi:hypothetical protein